MQDAADGGDTNKSAYKKRFYMRKLLFFLPSILALLRIIFPFMKPKRSPEMRKVKYGKAKKRDIRIDDIIEIKKPHSCGGKRMVILQVSGDKLKLKCMFCGREFIVLRSKYEKTAKIIL